MANVDNPNGFRVVKSLVGNIQYMSATLAGSQTVAVGDLLVLDRINGNLRIAVATDDAIYGVAQEARTTTGEISFVPALPWYVFEGQCSGTYTAAMEGRICDFEGTTGIMEVNENSMVKGHLQILELMNDGVNAVGANAKVQFQIRRSQFMESKFDLPVGGASTTLTTNTSLSSLHCGYNILVVGSTDITLTLPTLDTNGDGTQFSFTIINAMAPGACLLTVATAAGDKIIGLGQAGTAGSDLLNTKATNETGDRVKLYGNDWSNYVVIEAVGTWAWA